MVDGTSDVDRASPPEHSVVHLAPGFVICEAFGSRVLLFQRLESDEDPWQPRRSMLAIFRERFSFAKPRSEAVHRLLTCGRIRGTLGPNSYNAK